MFKAVVGHITQREVFTFCFCIFLLFCFVFAKGVDISRTIVWDSGGEKLLFLEFEFLKMFLFQINTIKMYIFIEYSMISEYMYIE